MTSLFQILFVILDIIWWIVIIHIIMSWLINFQVLNLRQPIVAQIWYGLNRLLEPIYSPIRNALPQMGGLDIAVNSTGLALGGPFLEFGEEDLDTLIALQFEGFGAQEHERREEFGILVAGGDGDQRVEQRKRLLPAA